MTDGLRPAGSGAPSVLVAGVGNIFFGDDGFGVEVARRLSERDLPAGVEVVDVGIRAVHLALQLLDGYDALVLVDALPHGAEPGSLVVLEPQLDPVPVGGTNGTGPAAPAVVIDPHGLDPAGVLVTIGAFGASAGRTLVVGCEPADVGERIGLSPPVERALDAAVVLVERLVAEERARCTDERRSEP